MSFRIFCFLWVGVARSILVDDAVQASVVIDFNELSLQPNSFFDGYGFGAATGTWTSQGATFQTNQFGPGWSYSNVNDPSTAGFNNQWSAITGTGVGGSGNYALATATVFPTPGLRPSVNLPAFHQPASIQVTNSTYAYLAMQSGDSFTKKFGGLDGTDPDFFKVTFTGYSGLDGTGTITGAVDFFLGDFRFANAAQDYLINQWTNVDLSGLGLAASMQIGFDGSDVGNFGLNTPAYIAVDNFVLTAIPEPSCLGLSGAFLLFSKFRRRSRFFSAARRSTATRSIPVARVTS